MFTVKQVAEALGLSLSKVYELTRSGALVSYRFGSAIRFEATDVERYKAECRVAVRPPPRARLTAVTLRASSPEGESELTKYFRRMGVEPNRSP